jgi:hypothetical protein
MSSQYKLPTDRKLIFYEKPFFTGYTVCLSNDEGLRYYDITRNTCEEYLNNLNKKFASHNKIVYPSHYYFEILLGTNVKVEVVKVFKFQWGCYEKTHISSELKLFINNNECINKNLRGIKGNYPVEIITG